VGGPGEQLRGDRLSGGGRSNGLSLLDPLEQLVRDGAGAALEMSCECPLAFEVLLLCEVGQPETAPAHHQSTMRFLLAGIDRVHPAVDLDARSVVLAIEPVPTEAIQQRHELVA
jgi:hypothetical protein